MGIVESLAKRKSLLGIAIAGVILTAIFVPFQKANAYSVDLTLPNASTSAVPTSAVGSTFKVTVDVSAGELLSISQIELILDNGGSGVKQAFFDSDGQRTSGSPTLVRGNLDVTVPTPSQYGYGYGYGLASSGSSFSGPYSYAFSYGYAYIAGNNVGYSNAVGGANNVFGFVGPGQIVIEGKLNTAQMDVGTHTLDVLIHTGAGGNGVDKVVAPQLTFTTVGNSSIQSAHFAAGSNQEKQFNVPGLGKVKVKFANISGAGDLKLEPASDSAIQTGYPGIFTVLGNFPKFNVTGTSYNGVGQIFDIDASQLTFTGPITITLPFEPSGVPLNKLSDLKIVHYNTSTNTWEIATNISIDTNNDTITGTLTSLSPVTVGIPSSSTTVSTTTGTGGGGGGGGGFGVDLADTHPDSYFVNNPLAKVQFQDNKVIGSNGQTIYGAKIGQQVMIQTSFKNYQEKSQNYAIVVQITDQNGYTANVGWLTGTLTAGQNTQTSKSWTVEEAGTYTIKVFVWDGVNGAPTPLSDTTTRDFTVS